MIPAVWNLPPPPGFRGLDPATPLTVYYRHLPHWRQDGASYFVTFRLADSLPKEKLQELALHKEEWEKSHPPPRSSKDWQDFAKQAIARAEAWLDQGMGACWLRQPWAAQIIDKALHFFDGLRYELGCFVIMPNHVHAVLRPLQPARQPLEKILQSRKRTTAVQINKALSREGELWQEESFDRIIRDQEHLYRCIQYIGNNPRKSQLPKDEWRRWIRPDWESLGWRFDE
jgi:REP element-mobilizing transposase RayT